jgi:predicted transcriptional regulator
MSFTITKLAGDRALVKGRDTLGTHGQQILDAAEWNELNAHNKHKSAHEAFDAAVEEFFAPLNDAIAEIKTSVKPKQDPLFFVTVQEKSEAVAGTDEVLVRLSHDSAVLRLVEQDPDTARLIWVNDNLEILEQEDITSTQVQATQAQAVAIDVTNEDGTEDEGLTKA